MGERSLEKAWVHIAAIAKETALSLPKLEAPGSNRKENAALTSKTEEAYPSSGCQLRSKQPGVRHLAIFSAKLMLLERNVSAAAGEQWRELVFCD